MGTGICGPKSLIIHHTFTSGNWRAWWKRINCDVKIWLAVSWTHGLWYWPITDYRPIWPMMSCCHDIQFKFFISWRSVTKTRMFLTLIIKLVRSAICFTLSHPLLSSHLVKKSTLGNKGVGYKSILIVILLVTSLLNQTLFITSEPMILLVLVCSVINFCILMLGRVTNVACFWIHRGFLQLEIFFSLILYRLIVPQYWIFIDFTFGVVYSSWRCLIQKGKLIVESMCAWLWTHHSWRKFGFFKNDQENRKWFHKLHTLRNISM